MNVRHHRNACTRSYKYAVVESVIEDTPMCSWMRNNVFFSILEINSTYIMPVRAVERCDATDASWRLSGTLKERLLMRKKC